MGEPAQNLDNAEHWLVDTATGKVFALHDGFKVGRAGGDLQIVDPSVSGKHCVFYVKGKTLEVEDVGSRNGTLVDGRKIEPKKRLALLPGVKVEIGNRTFEVKSGAEPKARATAVELASLCSQLEPDNIPAPHPSAWSSAVVPGGRGALPQRSPHTGMTVTRTASVPAQSRVKAGGDGGVLKRVVIAVVVIALVAGVGAWFAVPGGLAGIARMITQKPAPVARP